MENRLCCFTCAACSHIWTVFIAVLILKCVIMFSLCLLNCPQYHSLSLFPRHSSPLTAFTISHFSKLFSHFLTILSSFLPPPLHLISPLAFLSFPLPASTLTHSSSEWVFPPLLFLLTLLSWLPFNFYLSLFSIHSSFLLSTSLDLCLPSGSPVFQPLFLPLYYFTFFIWLALFLSSLQSCDFITFFPFLDSVPSLLYFSSSVYCLIFWFVLTSVFQAHCLFSVLSETVVEAVRGSY